MSAVLLLAVAVTWFYRRVCGGRAGGSAAARARQLRPALSWLAVLTGRSTGTSREAARWKAGAEGERRTAARLGPLWLRLWIVLHDRRLPTGRANVDHLVVTFGGTVFVLDTKRWSSRYRVRVSGRRLLHGTQDVTDRLRGLHHEARTVAAVLGRPVIPVIAMDGPPVDGGELLIEGIRIVPADSLVPTLRCLARRPSGFGPLIGWRAARLLKPYRRN
ncbi:nuclease-related domain-containing protein [Streptomyces sp. SRF1]|uniref:nuclease-related domain-containing protein n=1 Tax=Streptomyces sp. SRF1 TaxID=1549642 RepID=UPI0025B23BC2|nr:nuclease-related domain-containing protein [Streptomyces sp. SRF1]MDN3056888.1 nuclease-related domain-containing protein [Streptomyces sp. SRF1]